MADNLADALAEVEDGWDVFYQVWEGAECSGTYPTRQAAFEAVDCIYKGYLRIGGTFTATIEVIECKRLAIVTTGPPWNSVPVLRPDGR